MLKVALNTITPYISLTWHVYKAISSLSSLQKLFHQLQISVFNFVCFLTDVDECKAITFPCLHGGDCFNTLGSYTCRCKNGYQGPICADGKLPLNFVTKKFDHSMTKDFFSLASLNWNYANGLLISWIFWSIQFKNKIRRKQSEINKLKWINFSPHIYIVNNNDFFFTNFGDGLT